LTRARPGYGQQQLNRAVLVPMVLQLLLTTGPLELGRHAVLNVWVRARNPSLESKSQINSRVTGARRAHRVDRIDVLASPQVIARQ